MPRLKRYNIFISHAWSHSDEYYRLENLLGEAPYLSWRNYSVPEHDGFGSMSPKELEAELLDQIKPASVVIILAGMYVNNHYWIQKEIDIAKKLGKPILGVIPRGNERVPELVTEASNGDLIGWNTQSIIDAIRMKSLDLGKVELSTSENVEKNDSWSNFFTVLTIVTGAVILGAIINQYIKQKQSQGPSLKPKMPW